MSLIERGYVLDGKDLKHGDAIRLLYLNRWVYGTIDVFWGKMYLVGEHIREEAGILLEVNMEAARVRFDQAKEKPFELGAFQSLFLDSN